MSQDTTLHNRQSIRMRGVDYSRRGFYFITICLYKNQRLFGYVKDGIMNLNEAGRAADRCWQEIPQHFLSVRIHDYVIMPDHMHGIIEIIHNDNDHWEHDNKTGNNRENDNKTDNGGIDNREVDNDQKEMDLVQNAPGSILSTPFQVNKYQHIIPHSVGSIIRGYKIGVTKWFRQTMPNEFPTVRKIWHRNFYESFIKDDDSFKAISKYIISNPAKWTANKKG